MVVPVAPLLQVTTPLQPVASSVTDCPAHMVVGVVAATSGGAGELGSLRLVVPPGVEIQSFSVTVIPV